MADGNQRLNAVIAALDQVRSHVEDLDETEDVSVSTYNRWIAMLDGVVDGDWKSLLLQGDTLPASEMLMHTDAAIAFLTAHQQSAD